MNGTLADMADKYEAWLQNSVKCSVTPLCASMFFDVTK
jgi:hypothetical protein